MTGLGQALAYLKRFSQAVLVVPDEAYGFKIGKYFSELAEEAPLQIGIISYDHQTMDRPQLIHPPPAEPVGPLERRASLSSTFWAFWMDQSVHEFYLMLKTAYEMKNRTGDIRKDVFTKVFGMMKAGDTYANDGRKRSLSPNLKFSAWFLNYKLSFEHCELWGVDGKLTRRGLAIYQIAETYSWDSDQFRSALARAFLEAGRHLVLMKYIWNIQMDFLGEKVVHDTISEYLDLMRDHLVALGFGKPPGVRKELQKMESLWGGGLRILRRIGGRYYLREFGLVPDWPKINEIMTSDV